jgi:hypothetical protein
VILSDQADLSITFPHQQDSAKHFAAGCVVGIVIGFILFHFGVTSLLWVPVMGALSGSAGILISRSTATEATVRGDLPDIIAHSADLASWLSAGSGRTVHLKIWDKIQLELDARTPKKSTQCFRIRKIALAASTAGYRPQPYLPEIYRRIVGKLLAPRMKKRLI